jgi:hypothetical protein
MERNSNWIQTFTGRKFWPLEPTADDICLEDIAHALSNICRFNGHSLSFYSVAQHAVFVADIIKDLGYDREFQFYGLHHDDSEAYLSDITRPVKAYLPNYKMIESNLEKIVLEHFKITDSELKHDVMKKADNIALVTEAKYLMSLPPSDWSIKEKPLDKPIITLGPREAEALFLAKHLELNNVQES